MNKIRKFTLIEVTIAVAILAMGLLTAMNMSSTGRQRVLKAENNWNYQHIISQAAEYYLLAGHNASIPNSIFPYEDYSVSCSLIEPENLPEGVEFQFKGARLMTYQIELRDSNGEIVSSLKIDKILTEEDL